MQAMSIAARWSNLRMQYLQFRKECNPFPSVGRRQYYSIRIERLKLTDEHSQIHLSIGSTVNGSLEGAEQ